MKPSTSRSHTHYIPLHQTERIEAPYICRIAPSTTGFSFDYIDEKKKMPHTA